MDEIKKRSILFLLTATACLWMVVNWLTPSSLMAGETLNHVRASKELRCGVTEQLLGFSFRDESGRWRGFNVDFCRAVAVAVLGDAEKVSFVPLTSPKRFPALLSGRIDLLAHTATWTFGREAGIGIQFPVTYFFAAQTFMVPAGREINKLEDLRGATICVEKGTTHQGNMANTFQARGITFTPLIVDSQKELRDAFLGGRCQACTAERSVLSELRAGIPGGEEKFQILPGAISKEPLSPAVRKGDEEWVTLVRWVLFALIEAEELGVTSTNVRTLQTTATDPQVKWFLNSSGERGKALGLKPDWVAQVIAAVGNYGEIYERNFGSASGLKIERGVNRLWKDGGLLYAPPFQ